MAAQLAEDPTLTVTRVKGRFGELRVAVDGFDVVRANPLAYPAPKAVVKRVRAHLARGA